MAPSSPFRRVRGRLRAGLDVLRRGAVTDALFFDEAAYRAENEDVAGSLEAGKVHSSYDHFVRYGKWEGRRFALRRYGLGDATAARLYAVATRIEVELDRALCAASYGEVAHRLRTQEGERLVKPVGPWKRQLDRGPWRVRLPGWMRRGGFFMVAARIAPLRAPIAFRPLGADGVATGPAAAMFCRPTRATRRLVRLPAGTTQLEVELLDQRLRTQPLRVALRPVPDRLVEARMLRRLTHHHQRFLSRTAREITSTLREESEATGRSLREVMWDAYDITFPAPLPHAGYKDWMRTVEEPELEALERDVEARIEALARRPRISVLVPVCDPPLDHLVRCLQSVREQSYPHWELCVVDDASRAPYVRETLQALAAEEPRARVSFRAENGHICRASNDALAAARGELVALLDHDDVLPRHALFRVAEAAAAHPDARVFYGDEDKLTEGDVRDHPHFKPKFDPELLLAQNYLGHLLAIDAELARDVGGFRPGYEGSQDHDLVLRVTERLGAEQIVHVPHILYHWRMSDESTSSSPDAKPYTSSAGLSAVRDALGRRGERATVVPAEVANCYRVVRAVPEPAPLVSMIVPTRDAPKLVKTCLDSVLRKTDYPSFELIVVDNGTTDRAALAYLSLVDRDPRVRLVRDDRAFNFSALNNHAARLARGQVLVLLNNDIEVLDGGWLRELVSHAVRPDVGCVGAKLLYPDGTLQHAGVVTGLHGLAGHPYRLMSGHYPGYYGRLSAPHTVSAVTAACLAIDRDLYFEVGGLDEELAVAFNDVDFCLKVREAGYRNVLAPQAVLMHHESATRGLDQAADKRRRFMAEVEYVKRRWSHSLYEDPFYSPHLSLDHDDYSLRIAH